LLDKIKDYFNLDVESPYNREAAQWARTQTTYRFPIDPRPLRGHVADTDEALRPPGVTAEPVAASQCRYPTEGFLRPAPSLLELDEPEIRFMEDELEIVDAELVPGRSPLEETPDILFID
ncbi:MAG: hypothetical protein JJ992_16250, partial [Planctomycetes bacterium]|nr:hypothetical protein [Planctomycetota bacterium]